MFLDQQGRPVVLGREIARGGEGIVSELRDYPNLVAKHYLGPIQAEKAEKLRWMVTNPPLGLRAIAAWPVSTLHKSPVREMCGFIMPKVVGYRPIHLLSATASRRKEFPTADWAFLAQTALRVAEAFETLHGAGHLMADVNESNVLVSPRDASVRLIDCDSFQVKADGKRFLCEVGVPLYTAPELQGQDFRNLVRTPAHDGFGLAVLLFQLLFLGRHPFSGVFLGKGDMPPERAIGEFRFAYGRDARRFEMGPPPVYLPLATVTPELVERFERAFSPTSPRAGRPTAADWKQALAALLQKVQTCPHEKAHRFPSHLPECPWCRLLANRGAPFFVSVTSTGQTISFICSASELTTLMREAEKILSTPLRSAPALPTLPAAPSSLPQSALSELAHVQKASAVTAIGALVSVFAIWALLLWAPIFGGALLTFTLPQVFAAAFVWRMRYRALTFPALVHERQKALETAHTQVGLIQREYDAWIVQDARKLQTMRGRLHEAQEAFARLQTSYDAAKQRLLQNRETAQRNEFLRNTLIEDHEFEGIKDGLKRALVQFGIESAFDVLHEDVRRVHGFGEIRAARLKQWAREIEFAFRFNASKGINPTEIQSLVFSFQQKKSIARARIEAEVATLRTIAKEREEHSTQLAKRIKHAQETLVAAASALPVTEGALAAALQRRPWESGNYWATLSALFTIALILLPVWRTAPDLKAASSEKEQSPVMTAPPPVVATEPPRPSTARVLARPCILRGGASSQALPIETLTAGTTVHLETMEEGWRRVTLLDGREGYIGPICFVPLRPKN